LTLLFTACGSDKRMDYYRHILLAADFSEHDHQVARKAKDLARCFHATLSIVHVLDNIPMPDTPYGTLIRMQKDSGNALLERQKSKLTQISQILEISPDRQWMVWGIPEQEILRIAEREHVDLIIAGSRGRHGLALLLGSTLEGVLHRVRCDLMAIHIQEEKASDG
jgi:universal stress protein A